jgi:hypothetical protein
MRRPHIVDRRSRTSLGTTAPVQPAPHRMQKTSQCEVIGRHPNNFAEHNRNNVAIFNECLAINGRVHT